MTDKISMNFLIAIFLGTIQGATEFLPVSSTGHLILAEKFLHVSQEQFGLSFDAALHLGTFVAVAIYFKAKLLRLLKSPIIFMLSIATVPAVVAGLLLEDIVSTTFRSPYLIAWMLILFSLLYIGIEWYAKKTRTMEQLGMVQSVLIGCAQAVALIPGVSRSGSTISAGMLAGLSREQAAEFAFLLSLPITLGAGGKKFIGTLQLWNMGQMPMSEIGIFIVGMLTAAVVGLATIHYLLRFLKHGTLYPFIIYRIVLGVGILLFL